MQTIDLNRASLRRLAELRPEGARVISIFVDLDPSEFATPQARTTQVHSLLDDARRRVDADEELSHDGLAAVRADLGELRSYFESDGFDAAGARGMAVFVCGAAELFEVVHLPRAVQSAIAIDDSPLVEPLAEQLTEGTWAVLLVNAKTGRLLLGSRDRLEEVPSFREEVESPLDQSGGGSQARNDRAADKEIKDHYKQVAAVLFGLTKRVEMNRLLIGAPREVYAAMEPELHSYLQQRLAGHVEVDVDHASVEDVHRAAAPLFEEDERRREREALDRMEQGLGTGGRGAAGLEDVLASLNERRVEILLFSEGRSAPGVVCQSCGWVGPEVTACPVDGGELQRRDDVIESAVELALEQSADVMVPHHHDDLERHDGIAAVLRF